MKLIFCIKRLENMPGGAERILCAVASHLAMNGHEVMVVTFDKIGAIPFYEIHESIKVINLGVGNSAKPSQGFETARRIWSLRRLLLALKPDAVIGFSHSMFLILALTCMRHRFALVGSEHIVPDHYRSRPIQRALYWLLAPLIDAITVISDDIRNSFPERIRRKMVIINNPVVMNFDIESLAQPRENTILNIGRLVPQKDHATLLRAFAEISDRYPLWRLKIFGDGPLSESLNKLSHELGIEKYIHWMGVTDNLEEHYLTSSIFCLSSRYESFGLVVAEAMKAKLPVVAFKDCPALDRLVDHDSTGFLVGNEPSRASSLARALAVLMNNKNMRESMGENAHEAIDKGLSIDIIGDRWEKLIEMLVVDCESR